ncbi:Lrp/AsnC family transcriptional regulator [Candidatus Woesearchaeota archaeon]|nr:Lrp/AsnC family transcriptional regulator [Candidatus Woesearchaeota archaeon]
MFKIKPIDKKILNLIQEEDLCVPRITKIAHKLHLPSSTVQARLNKLSKEKIITGCTVLIDPEKVEKNFVAFIFGQAKLGKEMDLEKPIQDLKKIEEIQEIFFITGDYDYLIKIRVKDQHEYYEVVQKIAKCFEVRGKGLVAPKCFKDDPKLRIK